MSDTRIAAGEQAGTSAPHPVDAVLAALRAVPDSVLRPLEPATIYLPGPSPVGGASAGAGDAGDDGASRGPR